MCLTRIVALLTLPLALFTADAAAQLDPYKNDYTRVELTFDDGVLPLHSAVLTARTNSGSFTAGDEHWSLTQSFLQSVQSAQNGDTLKLDASAGSQYWAHGAPQFPVVGALGSFKMPSALPASGWTQRTTLPPDAFYASTSNTNNLGVAFNLIPPVSPSTTWGGSITWYVLAAAAPTTYLVASGTAPTLTHRAAPPPAFGRHWYSYTLTPVSP